MIRSPAGFGGDDRIKRYTDYYQAGNGVSMLSSGLFGAATPAGNLLGDEPDGFAIDFTSSPPQMLNRSSTGAVTQYNGRPFAEQGGLLTFSRTSTATVTDSDQKIKWAGHNLVLNSASPATQTVTVVVGAQYTVAMTGAGSVALSGAGVATATSAAPAIITATTTSLVLTVSGVVSTLWAYRSDLGGMVLNPLTETTYYPTTGAIYQAPRIDYNITTGAQQGFLIEGARQNSLLNSVLAGGVSGAPGTAPTSWSYFTSGVPTVTFATDTETGTGNTVRVTLGTSERQQFSQSVSVSANTTYTFSIIVDVYVSNVVYNFVSWFSLPAGATQIWQVDGVTVANTSAMPLGRRVISNILTVAATAGTPTARFGAGLQAGATGIDALYRRPQVEVGGNRSSYLPTYGVALSRAADVVTMPTSYVVFFATAGTHVASFTPQLISTTNEIVSLSDGTTNEVIESSAGLTSHLVVTDGGTPQCDIDAGTLTVNTTAKLGAVYSANDFAASINGAAAVTDTSGTMPTVTTFYFGQSSAGNQLSGVLTQFTFIPRRISNAQLQSRTA
jgi:hypothetical protein